MVFPFKGRNVGLPESFRGKKFFQFQVFKAFFKKYFFLQTALKNYSLPSSSLLLSV